jgi:hypothetical protein
MILACNSKALWRFNPWRIISEDKNIVHQF